jgi:hypothetical protein
MKPVNRTKLDDPLDGIVRMLAEFAVEDYLQEPQQQPRPKNLKSSARRAAADCPKVKKK